METGSSVHSGKDVDSSLNDKYKKESGKTCDPALANRGIDLDNETVNHSKCAH